MSHNTISGVSRYPATLIVGSLAAAFAMLCVMGCVSSEPRREFHDGPMVRPAPAFVAPGHTPAGAGLPEYMPGPPNPVQRGTDTRVLPPTKEPGIWASDRPKVSGELETPVMLGINIPVPVDDDDKPDYWVANMCAQTVYTTFLDATLKLPAQKLRYEERECLVGRLYEACVNSITRDYKHNKQSLLDQGLAPSILQTIERSGDATTPVASGFRSEKCHKKTDTTAVNSIFKEAVRRW